MAVDDDEINIIIDKTRFFRQSVIFLYNIYKQRSYAQMQLVS